MGKSKDLFMQDREADIFDTENPFFNEPKKSHSDPFEALNNTFISQMDDYEDGNVNALETSIKMRQDYERLELQMNLRKTWMDENKESIENESSKYPEGYKGYKVTLQSKTTLNFKNIPAWQDLEKQKKDFEAKSKLALQMVNKGGLNVDTDGAEIPLPEVNVTSFVKFDKIKK